MEAALTMTTRETWLNGWTRSDGTVIVGTGSHCAGCGKSLGLISLALTGDEKWPDKIPDWPFDETTCPLHSRLFRDEGSTKTDLLTERLLRFKGARE